mmetsp:Transcript_91930/g.159483  ORF Transcript_91930/g.159483 Transcript_91930/m.159483 type:complete len:462 (-) Transcript_91930:52-1437(-)
MVVGCSRPQRSPWSSRRNLHLVYSTNWTWEECPEEVDIKMLPAELQKAARDLLFNKPLCCELTNINFREMLAKEARDRGFNVVRWPVRSKEDWLAIGDTARSGAMVPGPAAVLLHSWHGGYSKECIPAWDFYPVLDAIKGRHQLLYPSAKLDQLHSEKRYASALMPPTKFLHFIRRPGGSSEWDIAGDKNQKESQAMKTAVAELRTEAAAAGLPLKDVMIKQGLSWGGEAVARVAPNAVPTYIRQKVLPKVPAEAQTLTVLLQAKVELVAELRWVILDGKLRGRGWRTYNQAPRGKSVVDAGMKDEQESREALAEAGLVTNEATLREFEESFRSKVEQVYAEAVADADGEKPQYLRVDLLIDKQGRAWLGERESWGADLIKNTYNPNTQRYSRKDPSRPEVAAAMISRAVRSCPGRTTIAIASQKQARRIVKKTSVGSTKRKVLVPEGKSARSRTARCRTR